MPSDRLKTTLDKPYSPWSKGGSGPSAQPLSQATCQRALDAGECPPGPPAAATRAIIDHQIQPDQRSGATMSSRWHAFAMRRSGVRIPAAPPQRSACDLRKCGSEFDKARVCLTSAPPDRLCVHAMEYLQGGPGLMRRSFRRWTRRVRRRGCLRHRGEGVHRCAVVVDRQGRRPPGLQQHHR